MKIYKNVFGNIKDIKENVDNYHIEKIILDQDDLLKTIIIGITDHHEEISISLNDNKELKDGDIIFQDDHKMIIVIINSNKLISIVPIDLNQMGYISHNLGNRHVPCQFIDNKIYIVYDYLIEEWLIKNNYQFKVEFKKLDKPFEYAKLS